MIAAVLGSAFLDATGAPAEERFLKLTGGQIQARVSDMEITDEVHWGDVYRRNGALITTEIGHKTTGPSSGVSLLAQQTLP
jgi:hypothetical protein